MKNSHAGWVLILLMTCSAYSGCGKNNEEGQPPVEAPGAVPPPTPSPSTSPVPTSTRLENGKYGSDNLMMTVTNGGAEFEFSCAVGSIRHAIRVDENSNFSDRGTYLPTPGALPTNPPPTPLQATYSGYVTGDRIYLNVIVDGDDNPDGMGYVLRRGQNGPIVKCATPGG